MPNVLQTCLKCFKLKMMIVELKMAQPIESDKEPIDMLSSIGRMVQKSYLSSRTLVQTVKVKLQLVEVHRSLAKY